MARLKTDVKKATTKDFSVVLTESEIKRRFRLPDDAALTFTVPDEALRGQAVPIDGGLVARWTRNS